MNNKKNQSFNFFYSNPRFTGFLTFLLMLSLIGFIVSLRYKVNKENHENEMANILHPIEQNFQQILKTSYAATLSLTMAIKDDGRIENFDEIASQLIDKNSGIDAVQLVPGGIIKNIYPLKGNEAAMNYDILKSKYNTRKEAEKSIKRREIYFAGPFELIQGGKAVVGRLPVFKNSKFWGFTAILIKLETLIRSSGIESVDKSKYYFQFSKVNPQTNKVEFFLPNKTDFSKKYFQTATIPEGDWKLYIISSKSNKFDAEIIILSVFGVLLSLVSGLLISYLLKRPAELRKILRKKTKRLLISEKEYKALFDQAPIGIAKFDSVTGEYLEINKEYCAILGYTETEIKQLKFENFVHPDNLESFNLNMSKLLKEDISEFSLVKKVYHKSGKIILINLLITAIWKNGEKLKTHISIIEDITEKHLADKKIKKSFKVVTEQNKRLLNFSYIISHNLRSHTSNIQTIADLLEETTDHEERIEMIGLLKNVSKSLNETMQNLNEVVNIRSKKDLLIEKLNLKEYLEKTITLLDNNQLVKNGNLINEVPNTIFIDYNVSYLESILYNFISNAIRYTSANEKIEIKLSFDSEKNILHISDNGIGIDLEKNGENLFGLYKVFNDNPESKGVGLFIAKNQIDTMGGTVTVESKLNVGTVFSIYFKC
jgi:PAS domain S-box-containing protein